MSISRQLLLFLGEARFLGINMKVLTNPTYGYLQEYIESVPFTFEGNGDLIYAARNVLKKQYVNDLTLVVKSFKKPFLLNRIAYSFFRKSKALRSFMYSMEIKRLGFLTPDPVAMIEIYKNGLISNSYYICRYDTGETVRQVMEGKVEGNEALLTAFARYTAALHEKGILHLDYSPGNILFNRLPDGEFQFSIVDVNRMKLLSEIDCETVCQNMRRLCISREVLAFIMKEYASVRGWDTELVVKKAIEYSDAFFSQYTLRRAAKKEKAPFIILNIFLFRLSRKLRGCIPPSGISQILWKKEKTFYDAHLRPYDYCDLFLSDYSSR